MARFHRTRLLLGADKLQKLQQSSVMIVGCGAVGSFAIEALSRIGIGNITIVDFDRIEESNINRQLFALSSTVGMPKVDVAAARVRDINPDIAINPLNMFWNKNTDLDLRPDFVIDAIDSVASKIALYKWCGAHNVSFISSMGAARKTDISQIRVGKIYQTSVCPLASKIRKLARAENIPNFPVVYSTEAATPQSSGGREFGSIITVTGAFGLMLANYVVQQIISDK